MAQQQSNKAEPDDKKATAQYQATQFKIKGKYVAGFVIFGFLALALF